MIIAITPTGDRLKQFEICFELMMRQTVRPAKWFIIDDGINKLTNIADTKRVPIEINIIHREPNPGKITLKENLLAVIDRIEIHDKVIFFEDDDFYPATYIETISQILEANEYAVVGGIQRKYYNLNYTGYWEFSKTTFCTLNATGFCADEKILNILRKICRNSEGYKVDEEFWREIKSKDIPYLLHSDTKAQVIGIKAWNIGRKGAVEKKHLKSRRKYIYDKRFRKLNEYVGDMAERYKSFIRQGFLIGLWRSSLGAIFRFRSYFKS
jgi:hypothetical protein